MSERRYVPLLWAKDGELAALKQLPGDVKEKVLPFFEVAPIPWNYAEDCPQKTLDNHLAALVPKLRKAWGQDDSAFLDFEWIPLGDRMADGSHPVSYVFSQAKVAGLQVVPVVSTTRDSDYISAVAAVQKRDQRGICLRLVLDDLEDPSISVTIQSLLAGCGSKIAGTDLLVDLKDLRGSRLGQVSVALPRLIGRIPRLEHWRTFILAGTGFPDSLAGLPALRTSKVNRAEWHLWWDLKARGLKRQPMFGDYGISSPAPSEVDPRVMKPSAAIRYTAGGEWMIVKGRNLKDYGYLQFHDVCRAVVASKAYSGGAFSWGDRYISDCARRLTGTGNLTTWRKVGTSHHVTFVVRQLSSPSLS